MTIVLLSQTAVAFLSFLGVRAAFGEAQSVALLMGAGIMTVALAILCLLALALVRQKFVALATGLIVVKTTASVLLLALALDYARSLFRQHHGPVLGSWTTASAELWVLMGLATALPGATIAVAVILWRERSTKPEAQRAQ